MKKERKRKEKGRQAGNAFLNITCFLEDRFYHWFLLSTFRARKFKTLIRTTQ